MILAVKEAVREGESSRQPHHQMTADFPFGTAVAEGFAAGCKVHFMASTLTFLLNFVWGNHLYNIGAHFLCNRILLKSIMSLKPS